MNRQITEMLGASEGRYMTRAEQTPLRDFAAQLDARLAAMDEIGAREDALVEQTMRQVIEAYPDLERRHKEARTKGQRDLCFVLRYAAHAMVRGDAQYLDDALLTWLRTMLRSIGFTGNFLEDTFRLLEQVAAKELTPATAALIRPYLTQATQTLSGRAPAAATKG